MYYIYKIAYQISDEIKLRKENEKPFYWEQIHPEIREKTIEEVDQYLIGGGLSEEKLKEMTKNEKYMAVSEGLYAAELAEKNSRLAELEAAEAAAAESGFLNNTNQPTINNNITDGLKPSGETIPASGANGANEGTITGSEGTEGIKNPDDFSPMSTTPKKVSVPGEGNEPHPIEGEPGSITDPAKKTATPAPAGGASGSTSVKKEAMVIVKNAVDQMNQKDRTPDDQAQLVQNVIDELTRAKQSLYT